jgi:hypothetical protein
VRSGHYEAQVLRDLVFRRYGFAALHMEQVLSLLALLALLVQEHTF